VGIGNSGDDSADEFCAEILILWIFVVCYLYLIKNWEFYLKYIPDKEGSNP
jgi:hypothetical protein